MGAMDGVVSPEATITRAEAAIFTKSFAVRNAQCFCGG